MADFGWTLDDLFSEDLETAFLQKKPLLEKTVPEGVEVEQVLLNALLRDPELLDSVDITPADMKSPLAGMLLQAMQSAHEKGQSFDIYTLYSVTQGIAEAHKTDRSQVKAYLEQVSKALGDFRLVSQYVALIKEGRKREALADAFSKLAQQAMNGELTALKAEAEALLEKTGDTAHTERTLEDIAESTLAQIRDASTHPDGITGLKTGFHLLDHLTAGLHGSELTIVAARPSMGKTAFGINICYALARRKVPTAFFSLEMGGEQCLQRFITLSSGIEGEKLKSGKLTEEEWERVEESVERLQDYPLYLSETGGLSIAQIASKCRQWKKQHGIQVVFIDYLQLVAGTGRTRQQNREQEVGEVSRALKALSMELNIPIVCLAQLNRAVETRGDKRPMLSDLRESGSIEQDADNIFCLYRDDYYYPDTDDKGIAEVIIRKQRNGSLGTVKLAWIPERMEFGNLATDTDTTPTPTPTPPTEPTPTPTPTQREERKQEREELLTEEQAKTVRRLEALERYHERRQAEDPDYCQWTETGRIQREGEDGIPELDALKTEERGDKHE